MTDRIVAWIDRRAYLVLAVFVGLTVAFAVAATGLEGDSTASQEPGGAVFEIRDEIEERLPPIRHIMFVVAEARGDDILLAEPLRELAANVAALRDADARGELAPSGVESIPLLARRFDVNAGIDIVGAFTLADAAELALRQTFDVGLDDASDEMVKVALSRVLANPATAGLDGHLSAEATFEDATLLGQEIVLVRSPALLFAVSANNEPLGGGALQITPDDDPVTRQKERFNRNAQELLRGEESSLRLWAIAADLNETAEEQGQTSALFIVLAVVAAILIVGLALRSYWAMALTGTGLAVLMLWLDGISNLVGLKGGVIIELIVPIAMVSLGVDFAVHALARYREALTHGVQRAFRLGLGGVFTALVLATLTDSVAFLANATSGIESIVHFAIAAAIATSSAFVVLGVIAPLVRSRIDRGLGTDVRPVGRRERAAVVSAAVGVAAMSGGAVIVTVALSSLVGALLTALLAVVGLLLPYLVVRRRLAARAAPVARAESASTARSSESVGALVVAIARRPLLVGAATIAVTAVALVGALSLEGSFKVEDLFASDSDFAVSLDKLDRHGATQTGEPALLLIEGELSDPAMIGALASFVDRLAENERLARDSDGEVSIVDPQPLDLLQRLTTNAFAARAVAAETGVELTDSDGNGLPDTQVQLAAAWSYATTNGIPLDADTTVFTSADVRAVVDLSPDGPDVAVLTVQIPDPQQLNNTRAARDRLLDDLAQLEADPAIVRTGAAGSPLGRVATIDAGTDALQKSLPIAALAVFLVLALALRSFAFALATTVPMLLVAIWLYGAMALFGFGLNFVTATVGAISIGIGADYAVHMTERYRQERRRVGDHISAVRAAGTHTGLALVASAASTAVGFAIMGLAPMPLFATFGILTALMVVFALVASLVVLPPLLGIVDRVQRRRAS